MYSTTFDWILAPNASLSGVGAKQMTKESLSSKVNSIAASKDLYDFLEPSTHTRNLNPFVSSLRYNFLTTKTGIDEL